MVCPLRPDLRCPSGFGRGAAGSQDRRAAESEIGDRALNGVQSVEARAAAKEPFGPDSVEQFGGQVLEVGAAVE
ncbi:hypothetical protein GCM10022226_24310 [Sphaerisporangium flaviroseum]|uniref:Uncharacterized protein n=1 Tax=Sphaerisporangium flaviroseum TaxID=509199 RepID=A0ABP7HUW4_9ACTN